MKYKKLHPWLVSPAEAVRIQQTLRNEILLTPFLKTPELIAGADISFNRYSKTVYAGFVVLEFKTMKLVAASHSIVDVEFPYIPGLLSFREIPPLVQAWEKLKLKPDVLVFDGQGIAHPRRMGIASHMGLVLDIPTLGCAKSLLVGHFENLGENPGDFAPLIYKKEIVGAALRTKLRTQPVYISPGHKTDLDSAIRILMSTVRGYRIPEPTRQAHIWVNKLRIAAASGQETLNLVGHSISNSP